MRSGFWIFVLLVCSISSVYGQDPKTSTPKDSAKVYRNIEQYSSKRKFTRQVHKLLFKSTAPKKRQPKSKAPKRQFEQYQGKIIRNIDIVTLDPFGYSETDTAKKPRKYIERLGNHAHIKTKNFAIINWLLIKRNQPLDSLLVRESERLIRSQRYVRRVVITPVPIGSTSDSVDIAIRVLDSWSLIPNASVSSSKATYKLTDRNVFGFGHSAQHVYRRDHNNGKDAYSILYKIPNINHTYVNNEMEYSMDLNQHYQKRISFQRPFYSPVAKWAAGITALQRFYQDSLPNALGQQAYLNFKYAEWDAWASYAFPLFTESDEMARTTRFIVGAGYNQRNYSERPPLAYDTVSFYSPFRNYLIAIGLSSRQYVEDNYLFNYDIVEDVPVGKTLGLIFGTQDRKQSWRLYTGVEGSIGGYYRLGFFGGKIEYGTFWQESKQVQGTVNINATHFSNLQEWGSWKLRNFIKFDGSFGINRMQHVSDFLQLEGPNGMMGFEAPYYFGTQRMVLSGQVQTYSPWNVMGFRFNPYIHYNLGILANKNYSLKSSPLYSGFGLGLLVINDFLVFNSIQLSFSYFPKMPLHPNGVFKTNAFNNSDFGLMDFEFERPYIADYR